MFLLNPTRCLACGAVYDGISLEGYPAPCPNRYVSPHTEDFLVRVSKALSAIKQAEGGTWELEYAPKASHLEAIQAARREAVLAE